MITYPQTSEEIMYAIWFGERSIVYTRIADVNWRLIIFKEDFVIFLQCTNRFGVRLNLKLINDGVPQSRFTRFCALSLDLLCEIL